jgi:hypothetical protein
MKKNRSKEINREQIEKLSQAGVKFRGAGLYETLGPQWKDYFLFRMNKISVRPIVPTNRTFDECLKILSEKEI